MKGSKNILTYLELASDVSELLVDPLDLGLLALTVPDVGYEDREPSHAIATNSGHLYLFTQAERDVKSYPVTTRCVMFNGAVRVTHKQD